MTSPPRVPLTDDVVVTARTLTRAMGLVAALQVFVVVVCGLGAFGLMFGAMVDVRLAVAFVIAVATTVVWTARAAALGRAVADLGDMRHGLVHAHDRVVRGMFGIARAIALDAVALALLVALVALLVGG